jgi:multicomponent Na+:H+ antiporter subunit C
MELLEGIADRFNYWIYIIIMMIGLFAMISKNNLIKKLIGMSIFQTAIILFYVSIGYKENATIPILYHDQVHGAHHDEISVEESASHHEATKEIHAAASDHSDHAVSHTDHGSLEIDPDQFINPLPHVLMLTAIVVGVATLGVGLAITQKLYGEFGSIEESEILEQIKSTK